MKRNTVRNVRDELLTHINCNEAPDDLVHPRAILCAKIFFYPKGKRDGLQEFDLPMDYTPEQRKQWLESLNFTYDTAVRDIISGNVWFTDGTWYDREDVFDLEEKGYSIWYFRFPHPIPDELKSERYRVDEQVKKVMARVNRKFPQTLSKILSEAAFDIEEFTKGIGKL